MVQDHVQQVEQDLEEVQGERSAKYRELKKREETMRGTQLTCVLNTGC